jgi:hypothetical protein
MTPPNFWIFVIFSPLKKDLALDLYNFEFPLPKDLIEIGQLVLEKTIFEIF